MARLRRFVWALAATTIACAGTPAASVSPAPSTLAEPSTTRSTTTTLPETTVDRVVVVPTSGPVPYRVDANSPCMGRAEFGSPADSDYLLPFAVGEWHAVSQSYCRSQGGHRNQLAYDFVMPVGDEVLASRAGRVMGIREDSPDNGLGQGEHNYVFIQHEDGTVAFYAHLMQDGVDVAVGDHVEAGQFIAYAGNSGLTGRPHLHFGVYRGWPVREGLDVPVVFRNAEGEVDLLGGLATGHSYTALPVDQPAPGPPARPPNEYVALDLRDSGLAGANLWGYDFSESDLTGSDLSAATLTWCTLAGSILRVADLTFADLESADLRGADLSGAALVSANLTRADLRGATLVGADLSKAYLVVADLRGADLTGAVLEDTRFLGSTWDRSTRWPEGFTPPPQP